MHSSSNLRDIRNLDLMLGSSHSCSRCGKRFLAHSDNCPHCGNSNIIPIDTIKDLQRQSRAGSYALTWSRKEGFRVVSNEDQNGT